MRLTHPNMASEDISAALGMKPRFSWTAGEPRRRPDGVELPGTNDKTYWCCPLAVDPSSSLVDALRASISNLQNCKPFLQTFVETGGEIEYFIGWFTTATSGGDTLDWELLRQLADLKISLSLDVYGNRR